LLAHNPKGYGAPAGAHGIDLRLHAERAKRRAKRTHPAKLASLPDGTFIVLDGTAWLVHGDRLFGWSDSGYVASRRRPPLGDVEVLPPPVLTALLTAGYEPALHPSALGF